MKADIFFNLLSDTTRLRCLFLIHQEGELCVCELMHALQMIQPKISRHLALLRKSNVVLDRRAGIWVYYRLNPKLPPWTKEVLQRTFKGLEKIEPYSQDRVELKNMPNRPATCCES